MPTNLTSNSLVVVCGQDDRVGGGEWTDCGCGVRVVHDPAMAARALASHPGCDLVFMCYGCASARPGPISEALGRGLRDRDGVYETGMAEQLSEVGTDRIVDFLRKKTPQ